MNAKHLKIILVSSISILIIFVIALSSASLSFAASISPFVGTWNGTDVDGSLMTMVIGGKPSGPFNITVTDMYITYCDGEAGIQTGKGVLNSENPNTLDANMNLRCFKSNQMTSYQFTAVYNPGNDTLLIDGSIIWHRANLHLHGCGPVPLGLSAWWPGDGNSDEIVQGRNGAFRGDATTGPGLVDQSFLLDGDGDFIEVNDDPLFNFAGDFTIDLWVNFNDTSGEQVLMEKWIQSEPPQGWTLTKLDYQAIRLSMNDGVYGDEVSLDSPVLDIQPNTWYFFAATRQGQSITLYMNGTVIARGEIDEAHSDFNLGSTSSLKFGHRGNPVDTPGSWDDRQFYLNGRIDEVEVYNGTALTQDQIFGIYLGGDNGKCKIYFTVLPTIRAHPEWNNVDIWFWPEDKILQLTVDDPGTENNPDVYLEKSSNDKYEGTVWFELVDYDLKPGDIVKVTDGLFTKELIISNLTIDSIDVNSDIVEGSADPGDTVRLPTPGELIVTANDDGHWIAYFAPDYDVQYETMMIAEESDNDGDCTSFEKWIPLPIIVASESGDWFWTSNFNPGTLDLYIYESADEGAALLWSGQREADESGFMSIGIEEHGQDLVPGNYLVITDGINTKTLVLEQISMEVFDTQNEIMAGTAPLGREVSAAAGPLEWQMRLQVQADPVNGTWLADFKSIDYDITEEMRGGSFAQIFDEDGDANEASVPPSLPSTFWDGFDAETLAPGWFWENGDSGQWGLGSYGEESGFLQLTASQNGTPEGNLLLRQIQQGDFSIETRFFFTPDTNFQFAGLVIYQDADNFLQLGRAFCNVEGMCVGNGLYFDQIAGGAMDGNNFATPLDELSETTLRLERRGDMIRAFYSVDGGMTWYELGTRWISPEFQVRGVGLVASQDFNTPESDISAYFDYFELNEDWNFLPEGFHDSPGGDVPSWECNGSGWAADPDNRSERLNVDIIVDDQTTASLVAQDFRQDLRDAEVCEDGNCSFYTSLWDAMEIYEPHRVDIWAQDPQTDEWVLLSSSNKTVTCRTYDIYSYDPLTGTTTQITNMRDADEYNPNWSPDGTQVAFIAWYGEGSSQNGIYITDLDTHTTAPLVGAENKGDAVWSPDGEWIVVNDYNDLYLIPSTGGEASLLMVDAVSADWAPSGDRLVYQRPSDGSIRTWAVGEDYDTERIIVSSGANPAWSPDGAWIAYEYDGDIWKVQVNTLGEVLGEPVQVTSGAFLDGKPTWSPDSQTIVYHSGFTAPEWDLWTVPAAGGMGAWLTGGIGFGDYDPAYAKDEAVIAYASFTPEGQAPRSWISAYTYDLPEGTWLAEGEYSLQFLFEDALTGETGIGGERTLSVSADAPIYDGYAVIRPWQIVVWDGETCVVVDEINPFQATRFHIGWTWSGTYAEVQNYSSNFKSTATWDGPSSGSSGTFTQHELFPYTNVDWMAYICSFTD